jgi:glutathione S-transferase
VAAKLYWFPMSHPGMAARKMLDLKGIDVQDVTVLAGMQRIHLRLAGFRGGTVPALKLDGRRIQGSRKIARAVEQVQPEPGLFALGAAQRAREDMAEVWGDEEFQDVPRIVLRWGLVRDVELRRWLAEESKMPMPAVAARVSGPTARYYAHVVGADEAAARRAVEELPQMLARADAWLTDETLRTDPPNAAALQVLCTVRALDSFSDLHQHVDAHPVAAAARRIFPDYPGPVPSFIPASWLATL